MKHRVVNNEITKPNIRISHCDSQVEWSKGKWTKFTQGGRTNIYYDEKIDMHVIEIGECCLSLCPWLVTRVDFLVCSRS